RVITGAEWAEYEGVDLGGPNLAYFTPWEEATLEKLASAEAWFENQTPTMRKVAMSSAPRRVSPKAIEVMRSRQFPLIAGELLKKAMVIDFETFAEIVTGEPVEELCKDAGFVNAIQSLPTLFRDIQKAGGCGCGDAAPLVEPDPFGCSLETNKDPIDRMMKEVGEDLGMQQPNVVARACRSIEPTLVIKIASAKPDKDAANAAFYDMVVKTYGYYVVKAAHSVSTHPDVQKD